MILRRCFKFFHPHRTSSFKPQGLKLKLQRHGFNLSTHPSQAYIGTYTTDNLTGQLIGTLVLLQEMIGSHATNHWALTVVPESDATTPTMQPRPNLSGGLSDLGSVERRNGAQATGLLLLSRHHHHR